MDAMDMDDLDAGAAEEISAVDLEMPDDSDIDMGELEVEDDLGDEELQAVSVDGEELEAMELDDGISGDGEFQAVPDVDLDDVDLEDIGLDDGGLDSSLVDEPIELDLDSPPLDDLEDDPGFSAMPDVNVDELDLEQELDLETVSGTDDLEDVDLDDDRDAWAGTELDDDEVEALQNGYDEDNVLPGLDDPDFEVMPGRMDAREDVVELNIADLEESQPRRAMHGNVPMGMEDALELPPDTIERAETRGVMTGTPTLGEDVLLSIPRKVNVEMGSVDLNGQELMSLTNGAVVQLGRMAGDPVQLVLEGRVIADGEIVLINGKNLGVRIVSIRR